jgi:UDP-2-acetamido-3-amino-2,3-dideoxy-glucuronate N-acetyltransferase
MSDIDLVGHPCRHHPGVYYVHKSAIASPYAKIGDGTKIWHFSHVMKGAKIGRNCTLGQNVHVASGAVIGDGCKIQNNVSIFDGVELSDGVFVGPSAVFTNVLTPRAFIDRKAEFKQTKIGTGATIGANATILCGVEIGEYALIGAGAVVTDIVGPHELWVGVPARGSGWVCRCGAVVSTTRAAEQGFRPQACTLCNPDQYLCLGCGTRFSVCPDPVNFKCTHCSSKIYTRREFGRSTRCNETVCGGDLTFIRAESHCLCTTCGLEYYEHPYCANSTVPASLRSSSVVVEYSLRVICGGMHVKL